MCTIQAMVNNNKLVKTKKRRNLSGDPISLAALCKCNSKSCTHLHPLVHITSHLPTCLKSSSIFFKRRDNLAHMYYAVVTSLDPIYDHVSVDYMK